MGLFDRFKRKKDPEPAAEPPAAPAPGLAPEPDTQAVILLNREIDWTTVSKAVEGRFGPQALVSTDTSVPNAPAMTFALEGAEFFCGYFAMPHPPQVYDLSSLPEGLFSPEERETLLAHKCFLVLAQKGGGTSLAEKRGICRLFTRLAGALMELDGAVGLFLAEAELLVSRRLYLQHAAILEQNWDDPAYFPAPLWVSIRGGLKGEAALTGTWGLKQFGFLELWFLDAKSPWPELHEKLYLMSIYQITGTELYKNMDTIAFTPGDPSLFRELNGALFIVGGGV